MKTTLRFLIERIESLFVDSIMIELDLNDHKSKFTKVVANVYVTYIYLSIKRIALYKPMYFEDKKYVFFNAILGGL